MIPSMDGDGNHKEYPFAVYLNTNKERREHNKDIDLGVLEELIKNLKPIGPRRISETCCGYIVWFLYERDANELVNLRMDGTFGSSVQVAKFSTGESPKKQILLLRDIPVAIPLQEIKLCLEKQGIYSAKVERLRQNVKVEFTDVIHYEKLLRSGLDFFGITRFSAVPERWKRSSMDATQDPVIQCYRCQHFWHIAAQCTRPARCVRCGGPHSVESCSRPREEPHCCHCGGPHHAAYRHCPYRLQMSSGFQLSLYPYQSTPASSSEDDLYIRSKRWLNK